MASYIIAGFVSKRVIKSFLPAKLLFSDAMLSTYFKLGDCNIEDIKFVSQCSNLETIAGDNYVVDRIWQILIDTSSNKSFRCFSFLLGYTCIEVAKIIKLIQNTEKSYVVVCSAAYHNIILRVLFEFGINERVTFHVVERDIFSELRYFFFHRLCLFYGKYNYVFYSLGLIWKFSYLFPRRRDLRRKKLIFLNDKTVTRAIQKTRFAGYECVDIDDFIKVPILLFIKNYLYYRSLSKDDYVNLKTKDFLDAHTGLNFLVEFLFAPFLEYFKAYNFKRFSSVNPSSIVLQTSDMSPHRYLIVEICNSLGLKTIVAQHGEISEPIVISRFVSSEAILVTEATYSIYREANPEKKVELLRSWSGAMGSAGVREIKRSDKPQDIYVFTCSFSGMSLDLNFSFNIEMVQQVLDVLRLRPSGAKVIIKLHPSESAKLYRRHFPGIQIESAPLTSCAARIGKAIVGPSTSYQELVELGVPVFYFGFGLQERVGFPKQVDFEAFEAFLGG